MLINLKKSGVCGKIYDLIEQMYINTSSKIRINNYFTDQIDSKNGVVQGNNLSPSLFNGYIKSLLCTLDRVDIGVKLPNCTINNLAHADDIVILAESEDDLQKLLDITSRWCADWRVLINTNKTKIVHFSNKQNTRVTKVFTMSNAIIEVVNNYKYLGVMLSSKLNNELLIDQLAGSASRALGFVISKTKHNMDLGYDSYSKLFESCVTPILDYGCGGWFTGNDCTKLDNVQNRAIRFFCGLPRNTSLAVLNREMGWVPGVVRRDIEVIRLYNQIIKMDTDRITYKVFDYDINLPKGCWSSNLRSIVRSICEMDNLQSHSKINITRCKQKLLADYQERLHEQISRQPKLRTYCKIAENVKVANHLNSNLSKLKRSLISRLRCGNLALNIETGRFKSIPVSERICNLCKSDCETEIHFLFECSKTNKIRVWLYKYAPDLLHESDNFEKFKSLCNMPYTCANYVDKLWRERSRLLTVCNNPNGVGV